MSTATPATAINTTKRGRTLRVLLGLGLLGLAVAMDTVAVGALPRILRLALGVGGLALGTLSLLQGLTGT